MVLQIQLYFILPSGLDGHLLFLKNAVTLFLGRVLGPVGGQGGSEFLPILLPHGVDIRNMHLDGFQVFLCIT
jgi:hypothetical protein